MREIRKKSVIPIYAIAAVWLIYALVFPLYKLIHFAILIVLCIAVYIILRKVCPDTVTYEEIPPEPKTTGDPKIDALLEEGDCAIGELRRLRASVPSETVAKKIDELIEITGKIFKDVEEDHSDYEDVKRFASYYVPTTLKLLNAYDRFSAQGIDGENISSTLDRIESILDKTIDAYRKELDSLFADQALDIETDIAVLESMMKSYGFDENDSIAALFRNEGK